MNAGKVVFAQIVGHLPRYEFDRYIKKNIMAITELEISPVMISFSTLPLPNIPIGRPLHNSLIRHSGGILFSLDQTTSENQTLGTSPNAVKTQIWVAVSIYLPVAILKKRLNLQAAHTQFYKL